MMLLTVLTAIWFFLPAAIANMFAIISRHFPFTNWLAFPIDGGKSFRGRRILGNGKTFRGFIFGIFFAAVFAIIQSEIYKNSFWLRENLTEDYSVINPIVWGALLGFGGLLGDSVKSFFKRRVGIERGHSWLGFDQADFVVGSTVISLLYIQLNFNTYLAYMVVFPLGHLIFKYIGFLLGIDDKPI
ncbi:MAG: CDP-2,3-bis-(O-geranylgeranyl)-sn-glycerol synthase [Candidatus Dojkabacteria bacterium]